MTRRWRGAALGVLLAGCSAMSESECRNADWYALGERDALVYGLRPQIELYLQKCSREQAEPAQKQYMTGWFYGERERGLRMGGEHP
jgi:hypothetical protein